MANIIPGVTTAQQAADIINNDRAKIGGDSSQNFIARWLYLGTVDNSGNAIGRTGTSSKWLIGSNKSVGGSDEDLAIWSYTGAVNLYHATNKKLTTTTTGVVVTGTVTANGYLPFTGCHVIPNKGQDFKIGELICIEAIESEDKKQPDWRGRYAKKGENGIFGIVFDEYEEPKPVPEIGVNKFYSVACLGDMKVFCNGENGNIEYGDELCASSKNGVAMKFTGKWEDRKQICGKAGRSHTFTSDEVVLIDTAKE